MSSSYENLYWQNRAALLDPAAYKFYQQTAVSPTLPQTVPAGGWLLRNSWYMRSQDASSGTRDKFFRNAREAVPLAAGTVLTGNQTNAFVYVCQPELVVGGADPRYVTDPQALYYQRLAQLQTLAQKDATCNPGYTPPTLTAPTSGMCLALLVSQFELTWSMLTKAGSNAGINLIDEIDDAATERRTAALMLPFKIATFDTLTPGTSYGAQNTAGNVTLTYVELPVGW